MSKNLYAFLFGIIFGLGLIIAQMTNPEKVLAFLDVAGDWDPSLALVMASALLVLGVSLRLFKSYANSDAETQQQNCDASTSGIDGKLVLGAAVFGTGWGLSGICPGPAIVDLSSGLQGNYVFAGAMFAGFFLFHILHSKR
ncbi:DUF6691 family protein [Methylomonas sp. AM2-LC]|uniref:DUF6691 family protein n=1 Tax=Methylomonas sp. AM2-LC TaxID=3153301 RepID=UPI0032656E83